VGRSAGRGVPPTTPRPGVGVTWTPRALGASGAERLGPAVRTRVARGAHDSGSTWAWATPSRPAAGEPLGPDARRRGCTAPPEAAPPPLRRPVDSVSSPRRVPPRRVRGRPSWANSAGRPPDGWRVGWDVEVIPGRRSRRDAVARRSRWSRAASRSVGAVGVSSSWCAETISTRSTSRVAGACRPVSARRVAVRSAGSGRWTSRVTGPERRSGDPPGSRRRPTNPATWASTEPSNTQRRRPGARARRRTLRRARRASSSGVGWLMGAPSGILRRSGTGWWGPDWL